MFSLSVAADSFDAQDFSVGTGAFVDAGTALYSGTVHLQTPTTVYLNCQSTKVGAAAPIIPSNADRYFLQVEYFV